LIALLGLAGLVVMAALAANGQPALAAGAPKAYVGLFKDNAVAVLDTSTNSVLSTIPVPTGPHGLVVTPDGRWVYVSSDGDSKVSVIDTMTDKVANTIEVGQMPHGLAITPDGHWVLAADFGTSEVVFINTATNQVAGQVAVPSPHNIAITPDGTMAYVAAQKQGATGLAILDLAQMTQVGNVPLGKTPRALNFSPDGKLLYFTLAGVDAVQVLDPTSNTITTQIPVGASPHHPLFTPDGKYGLVVSQGPGELDILAPDANSVSKTVPVGKLPHWIALDAKGTTAYVTNENSNDVSVVDIAEGTVTATIPVGNAPRKIVIQPQVPATGQSSTTSFQTTISGFAFAPTITIAAGQSIVWTNKDSVPHTVTSDTGLWDSGDIAGGATYQLTLDKPGTYTYHCMHHPYMTGTIVVTPS
jgi:YVTN family beta-propeller protein